jgi:hypothetical protein
MLSVACGTAPTGEASPLSSPESSVTISVPHVASHQACYDTLVNEAPALWSAFEREVLTAVNGDAPAWERLEPTLDAADRAYAEWLAAGGSARVASSSWACAVGDVCHALVQQSIDASASADPDARRSQLQLVKALVDARLAKSPNLMMMRFALLGALQ